jgi:hypothetical protein
MATTIVSCFLAHSNARTDRTVDVYLDYGKKLADIQVPKIIFMDETIIDTIEYDKQFTVMIPFKRDDIYLAKHREEITDFNPVTSFQEKDTIDYMFLMCNKTELVRQAIEVNPFNSDQFIWVDFGIYHLFRDRTQDEFETHITGMTNKVYPSVRIGSIINPDIQRTMHTDIFREVCWVFAGTIFGGDQTALIEFADFMKETTMGIVSHKGTIMWEVNIWYLIYKLHPQIFDMYQCDHNPSVVSAY